MHTKFCIFVSTANDSDRRILYESHDLLDELHLVNNRIEYKYKFSGTELVMKNLSNPLVTLAKVSGSWRMNKWQDIVWLATHGKFGLVERIGQPGTECNCIHQGSTRNFTRRTKRRITTKTRGNRTAGRMQNISTNARARKRNDNTNPG